MTASLPLVRNVLTLLAKGVLISLGLTTTVSATNAVIQYKIFESCATALIILNEEIELIMKILK